VWLDAAAVAAACRPAAAVAALTAALVAGLDPARDPARSAVPVEGGQLLLMPAELAPTATGPGPVGVKVLTLGGPAHDPARPLVQGLYLLFDGGTLAPAAVLSGAALTTLRTPAVSAAAADHLAPARIERMVVFGSGPQAWGHIEAMRGIREIGEVTIVARHSGRAEDLATRIRQSGQAASVGAAADVQRAQLIVCATTARTPLFDGSLVPADSCTVAVGSHEPGARELPSTLVGRAQVVVEDLAVALREGGDVLIPIDEGVIAADALVPLRSIATGTTAVDLDRPRVFTSSGMSWEDLVVATAVYRAR